MHRTALDFLLKTLGITVGNYAVLSLVIVWRRH